MNVYEVVKKLIGEIEPVGDSRIDEKRLQNLRTFSAVAEDMLCDLKKVSSFKGRPEYSVNQSGKFAKDALEYFKEEYCRGTP